MRPWHCCSHSKHAANSCAHTHTHTHTHTHAHTHLITRPPPPPSGINAIIFFAPQIFEATGAEQGDALLSTVVIGVTFVASTFIAIALTDKCAAAPLAA